MKKRVICFVLFFSVIFISGCIQSTKQNYQLTSADQIKLSDLLGKLNSNTVSYEGSYKKENEIHGWAGSAGSTDFAYEEEIFIVYDNYQVENYTINHTTTSGYSISNKGDYYKYYNPINGELCHQDLIGYAESMYSERPIAPAFGNIVEGCNIKADGGKYSCICDGNEVSVSYYDKVEPKFPCKKQIQTNGLILWDHPNIISYPEINESLCYFLAYSEESTEFQSAFECVNKNVRLTPKIETNEKLKNAFCISGEYDRGYCTFDPVKIDKGCQKQVPENLDSKTKNEIINYLKTIDIRSISEEYKDNDNCYVFSYYNLKHIFCFDEKNSITFAEWGSNISKKTSTSININKLEKYAKQS